MRDSRTSAVTSPGMSTTLTNTSTGIVIREFRRGDIDQLLQLMQKLAAFEHYLDDFCVTETALEERGLSAKPEFRIFVATSRARPNDLLGMAVFYFVPYTFDLRPDLILKELFVSEEARGHGIGRALMQKLIAIADRAGCRRIRWLVLTENAGGKRFYESLGARHDTKWENWQLIMPTPEDAKL